MIRIEEIEITRFGKIEGLIIKPEDGLNVIYGKNEAGKSTLQLFIKAMLYGLPTRRRSGESLKERDRAVPFSGGKASGVLRIDADGRSIEIRRRFGKTAAGDRSEICDGASGEKLTDYSADCPGEKLLGLSASMFEKTLWISQDGAFMGGRDDEISARLMNLCSSGDEDVSADSAIEELERRKRGLKARDGRSAKGRIDILHDRREECVREKYMISTVLEQNKRTGERIAALREEAGRVKNDIDEYDEKYKACVETDGAAAVKERLRRIEECDEKLKEVRNSGEYQRSKALTEEILTAAQQTEAKIAELKAAAGINDVGGIIEECRQRDTHAKKVIFGGAAIAAAAFVIALICIIVLKSAAAAGISFAVFGVGMAVIISGIRIAADCKNKEYEAKRVQSENERRERERAERLKAAETDFAKSLDGFGVKTAGELAALYASGLGLREREKSLEELRFSLLDGSSVEELRRILTDAENRAEMTKRIKTDLDEKRRRYNEITAERSKLESKMSYEINRHRIPADIETEISGIDSEIAECERQLAVIEAAEAAIGEAAAVWKSSVTPQLNSETDEIMKCLTGGVHSDIRVADDYKMRMTENSELLDAEYFSRGTYEQMYLALRLALAKLMCDERLLFLDDILTTYDDDRAAAAVRLLKNYGGRQIFLLTCHRSIREFAESIGANTIDLKS